MKYRKTIITVISVSVLISTLSACNRSHWGHSYEPEQRVEWVKEEINDRLDLTPTQNDELDRLADTLLQLHKERLAIRQEHKVELRKLLAAPTLDQTRILTMLRDHTQFVDVKAPEVVAAIARFTDTLNPEQKQEISERMDSWIEHHQ